MKTARHRVWSVSLAIATLAAPVWAQDKLPPTPPETASPSARDRLRDVQQTLAVSETERRKIEADIEAIRTDRARLNAALVATVTQAQDREARMADQERQLETALGSEEAIRQSLGSRRAVIGEILAALQRMGRRPPPAVLVSPDDMLRAIRTSMMLGAVLPDMRGEAEALASDLDDLVKLRISIAAQRDDLRTQATALASEKLRLAALVDARRTSQTEAEARLAAERLRASDLARQAADLQDLIARAEAEPSGQAAAEAARRADAGRDKAPDSRTLAAPFADPARMQPAVAFAATKGHLPWPASGSIIKTFGAGDGFGGVEKGLSIATRADAVVAAPADGWVLFSAPYRSYGQLLIINAGSGYYLVLAGMSSVSVDVGQFVLAGEPVGTMGTGSARTAAAVAVGATQPILYVEFRKDGVAVDPGPWWAKAESQKVRG